MSDKKRLGSHVKCESFAVECLSIWYVSEIPANIINDLVRFVWCSQLKMKHSPKLQLQIVDWIHCDAMHRLSSTYAKDSECLVFDSIVETTKMFALKCIVHSLTYGQNRIACFQFLLQSDKLKLQHYYCFIVCVSKLPSVRANIKYANGRQWRHYEIKRILGGCRLCVCRCHNHR